MPKQSRQKQKILYLARFLLERTDENHPATVQDMIAFLSHQGICAERKSIYADLEELRNFGLDIIQTRSKHCGYFVGEREFQLPEVRLLVDAVQSSRFLTKKKSEELIGKLQTLLSRGDAKSLSATVLVAGRIKTMNESIYRNVDAISRAIEEKKKISFTYFEWDEKGEKILRRDGAPYVASPYFLVWDDEKYYLVALEEESGEKRHFRVEKMLSIRLLDTPRDGEDVFSKEDPVRYEKKTFGMYGGKEERVTLRCQKNVAGVFFDRFGSMVTRKVPDGFEVTLPVEISPMFYSWLMGFGSRIQILSPQWVREDFQSRVREILSVYEKEEER
jgi:predicted DNA-binding transcriptional regulator YafY